MLVFLVFLESLAGVLLKRTKMTKRTKRTKRAKVTNITNKTIIYRGGGKNTTHGSTPAISETISPIGLARRVYSFSFLSPCLTVHLWPWS